jgi:hypothetical protein
MPESKLQCIDNRSNVLCHDHAGAPKMQRAFTIAQRVRAVVPKHNSQVTFASFHSSVVNAAIADDVAKASANLKRKHYTSNQTKILFVFQFQSVGT